MNKNEGKSVYLKVEEAKLIEKVGSNPIYWLESSNKFYVGLENLFIDGVEVENSVELSTLELAKEFVNKLPQ